MISVNLPNTFNWQQFSSAEVLLIAKVLRDRFLQRSDLTSLIKYALKDSTAMQRAAFFLKITPEQITDIVTHIEKLFEKIDLTEFKIRKFRSRFKTYHAPADYLKNVTILEFSKADHAFNQYMKTKEMQYLDRLVAVLYRPPRKKSERAGDIRVPFKAETLEADTQRMRRVQSKVKHAILLSFWGCRNHLVERFPAVFSEDSKKQPQSYGWAGLLLELSGGKFGDLKKTCDVNLYTVLMWLDMKLRRFGP